MTRVLLADDIVSAVTLVEALLASDSDIEVCGIARTPQELFLEVRALQPDVVVVRERFTGVDAFALAEEIPDIAPGTKVVIIADEDTPDGRTRAQRAGVAEYVTGELDGDTLTAAIHAAIREPMAVLADRRETEADAPSPDAPATWESGVDPPPPKTPGWLISEAPALADEPPSARAPVSWIDPPAAAAPMVAAAPGNAPTAPEPEAPQPDPDPIQPVVRRRRRQGSRKQAEIFIVFAGKGGVGKSTVATNLSCALAADGAKVVIVDLDLQFGDVGVMLGVEHNRTIEEIAQVGETVDMEYLEEILGTGPEGVRVLLAPASPELADLVTTGMLRATVRELAKNFDYVIIDAAAHLEEHTLEMIEMADHIVVVTAFNVTSVKDTKIMLKLLGSLGIDKEKIAVILNQTRQRINFTREEVEASLRFRMVTQLPFDPRIVDESIDLGKPFVLSEPKAEITRQFRNLVDFLAPPDQAAGVDGADSRGKGTDKPKAARRRFSLGRS